MGICETCLHRAVCGKYTATGGVNKCRDHKEERHGTWLDGGAVHNGKEVYKSIDCSVCEEYFKVESFDREYWKARFKVCPFCGAKMDGGNADG